jgi:hypothetical protein
MAYSDGCCGNLERLDDDGAPHTVVERLRHVGLRIGEHRELTYGNDRVPHAHARFLDLLLGTRAYVYIHILPLKKFRSLLLRQEVWRLGPYNPYDVTFMCFQENTLTEEDVVPPPAESRKPYKTVRRYVLHHEAYLVHVARQHHLWLGRLPGLFTNEAPHVVLAYGAQGFHVFPYNLAHVGFIARDAVGFGQFLKKYFGLIHSDCSLVRFFLIV